MDNFDSPYSIGSDDAGELPEAPAAAPQPGKQIDPAIAAANKGIEELNRVDENISAMLLSAGLAIKTLTTPASMLTHNIESSPTTPPPSDTPAQPSLPSQLETFKTHASEFHRLLDSVRVDLRRQILLQDQAEILAPLPTTSAAGPSGANAGAAGPNAGGFDIGLLNIRSDNVGKDMEEDLWKKARAFVEHLERAREAAEAERQLLGGNGGDSMGTEDGDVDMSRTDSFPGGDEILRF